MRRRRKSYKRVRDLVEERLLHRIVAIDKLT